jgi:hypothetical protein
MDNQGIVDIEGMDEISKKILVAAGIIVNSNDYPDEILISIGAVVH